MAIPVLLNADPANVTSTSAKLGGEITDAGGLEITERGIVSPTTTAIRDALKHNADGGESLLAVHNFKNDLIAGHFRLRVVYTNN